jgi:hypothetical protein
MVREILQLVTVRTKTKRKLKLQKLAWKGGGARECFAAKLTFPANTTNWNFESELNHLL